MEITTHPVSCVPHVIDSAASLVGGRTALARLLDVTVAAVGNWKVRGVPVEYCVAIEQATGGAVTRKNLRPNDWQKYWPELAAAPAEPAQAATKAVANPIDPLLDLDHSDQERRESDERREKERREKEQRDSERRAEDGKGA